MQDRTVPTVSVVMPAYNAEKYLREAIDSILAQTFDDFEFIIVNDGSTDSTKEIILSYDDPRIIYLENEQNSGICVTLNKGLDAARGKYIARMDADDISLPERFAHQVAYLDAHPEVGVLGSFVERITENGLTIDFPPSETNPYKCRASLLFSPCVAHPATMLRVSVLNDHKLRYDDNYRGMEDFYLWWNLSQHTQISNIETVLLKYRIHQNQVTQASINEDFLIHQQRFVRERLSRFGNDFTKQEIECFLKYMFSRKSFDDGELETFIHSLSKIVRSIKTDRKFRSSQKLVAGKAISYSYDLSSENLEKSNLYYMFNAYRQSCMPLSWIVRRIYHQFFRI